MSISMIQQLGFFILLFVIQSVSAEFDGGDAVALIFGLIIGNFN